MAFDPAAALARFRAGLSAGTSTQSWDVAGWSEGWRDADGRLSVDALDEAGGAWWFRAITSSGRLRGEAAEISSAPLTAVSAGACLAGFVGDANQLLVHWSVQSLAPAAFPLRAALGPNEALNVLVEHVEPTALAPFVEWLGPVDAEVAERWFGELTDLAAIVALGHNSGAYQAALERLTELNALSAAESIAPHLDATRHARWVLDNKRNVTLELLSRAVDDTDDELFEQLSRKVLRRRDRAVWQILQRRPLPALVPKVLERIEDPILPWVFQYLAEGGEPILDAVIDQALKRGKPGERAIAALAKFDQTTVTLRIESLVPAQRAKLLERLSPLRRDLPELPRSERKPWMNTISAYSPTAEPEWLDVEALPELVTLSGYRLPTDVSNGILSLLQAASFKTTQHGTTPRYDAVLDELRGVLEPGPANAWWNALFAMWWTHHRPDVRWVIYAAAFLCDGQAIRDLGAKLRQHRTWFGSLSSRVIVTLGQSPTRWAVAALDHIARSSRNVSHRDLARQQLETKATSAGQTVDRFVEANLPMETDPLLLDIAAQRLEEAMINGRMWTDFTWNEMTQRSPFADVAGAVLWRLQDEWGDFAFARADHEWLDSEDEPITSEPVAITVAHCAELTETERDAWNQRFADYEIVQPFDQLGRRRFRADSLSEDGFRSPVGTTIDGREFLRRASLSTWTPRRRGAHGDIVGVERTFTGFDAMAVLHFSEPLEQDGSGESKIKGITFHSSAGETLDGAVVSEAAFSEAHLEISKLTNKT